MVRSSLLILALVCATALPATAQTSLVGKRAPNVHCSAWANTEDFPTLANLRGRPVLVIIWGMRCQVCHCKDVLKKAEGVWQKYRGKGFVVLALHVQQATVHEADVYGLVNGLSFPIGAGGYHTGWGVKQVPKCFLVGCDGKVKWQSDTVGGEFNKKLVLELRDVDWLGERAFPKPLRHVSRLVVQRKYGLAIDQLINFMADIEQTDEDRKAARLFKEKLENMGDQAYLLATSHVRQGYVARGLKKLETLAKEYKGHAYSRKAAVRLKELRQDPAVQKLAKAGDIYRRFRSAVRKRSERGARVMAQRLLTLFPDSRYAKKTKELFQAMHTVD